MDKRKLERGRQTPEVLKKYPPKSCSQCNKVQPISEFHINRSWAVLSTGKKVRRYWIDSRCNTCQRLRIATKRLKPGYKEREKAFARSWKVRNTAAYLIKGCKARAVEKNIPFNLKPSDLTIPKICPILKHPMHLAEGYSEYSPSVDRVDNSKGYVKGNVAVISRLANAMKNHCDEKQLKVFAKNIIPYVKKYRRKST
jgi:hypothetical protein